jgi:hypothetical protein
MRERSFESVVRRKVVVAIAPVAGLMLASGVAVALTAGGFAALGAALSLGAAWLAIVYRNEIFRRGDRAGDYVIGLSSERVVRVELTPLKSRYFVSTTSRSRSAATSTTSSAARAGRSPSRRRRGDT